jgi:hypothetical protein
MSGHRQVAILLFYPDVHDRESYDDSLASSIRSPTSEMETPS